MRDRHFHGGVPLDMVMSEPFDLQDQQNTKGDDGFEGTAALSDAMNLILEKR